MFQLFLVSIKKKNLAMNFVGKGFNIDESTKTTIMTTEEEK